MRNLLKSFAVLWTASLILQCAVLTEANAADGANWVKKKIGGDARAGTAKWCGSSSNTIVWQGVISGIHLADFSSGTVKVITQSLRHADPFCSPDGRFVFFLDEATQKMLAYDLNTSKTTPIECLSKKVILSPDMKAAISIDGKGCDSINFPWGESVTIKKITGIQKQEYLSSLVTWFSDKQKVILMFIERFNTKTLAQPQSIAIYEFKNGKLSPIQLPDNPGPLKLSEDEKYLFYMGVADRKSIYDTEHYHLSKIDLEHIPAKAEQIQLNVEAFDAHPQRGLAVLKSDGALLVGTPGKGGLKRISRQKMEGIVKFSPDGNKLLSMKQDPYLGQDGPEGPPITSSIYVFFAK